MKDRVQRLQKIARLLDTQFEGPLGIRFGLDPLIGLIPVFGDAMTTLISFYIVVEAYRMGCSVSVLIRMLLNIFLEDLVKVIPVIGQLFDFYWKSNLKNLDLIEHHVQAPEKTRRASFLFLGVLVMSFLLTMTFVLAGSVWVVVWLAQLIRTS